MNRYCILAALLCGLALNSAPTAARPDDKKADKAQVTFNDVTLPCYVACTGPDGKTVEIDNEGGALTPGKYTLVTLSKYGGAWAQPVKYGVNDAELTELTAGKVVLTLKKNDKLKIHCGDVIAPWNSVVVVYTHPSRESKHPVLVGLARPWAGYDLKKWAADKGGKEEFPNSILYLAKYGEDAAKNLAKRWKEADNDRLEHISLVPSVGLKLDEKDVADLLKRGFAALQKKSPPKGDSIGDDLANAKAFLKVWPTFPK